LNRRRFAESLGALIVAARAGHSGRTSILNAEEPGHRGRNETTASGPIPLPASTENTQAPTVSLAGEWKFTATPPAEFWRQEVDTSAWATVQMPNEFASLGFQLTPNWEYPCRRIVRIPSDYRSSRIFLRFDGVYGHARVWVNGVYLREHCGGFTSWDAEITEHVTAGQDAELVLGITDRSDDISQASYYAKHSIAGILRSVTLFAVPRSFVSSLITEATLDSQYRNGVMHISATINGGFVGSAVLRLELTGDDGKPVVLKPNEIPIDSRSKRTDIDIAVPAPKRWDSEHPNLYLLEAALTVDGTVTEAIQRRIGFRTVQRAGNQLMVNGQPVKLRGVCRHSMHPTFGRAVPQEFDEMDAELLRRGNINFVRTSHYPPSEQFLDACDRHGIYLEEETAVCWSNESTESFSNPEFRSRFMNQFQEMVARDRHHAAVLFWSLGNESHWGSNFEAERKFATSRDPSRPTIFSYPDTSPLATSAFDIYSKHYAEAGSDLSSATYPLLNDEFAHVSCYNLDTLRHDPGVRDFWGESMRQFGEAFLVSDGCLGGSIWAGIDEVFLLPGGPVGYGPWGIIDGWRREKPEYWLTRKAYSPVRIEDRPVSAPERSEALVIPIGNAFDHTNFKEVEIRWSCGGDSGRITDLDLAPHQSGYLEIPPRKWKPGEVLELGFYVRSEMVDQFRLPVDPRPPAIAMPRAASANLEKTEDSLVVSGPHVSIWISRPTGLIQRATFDGQVVLTGGPYIDLGGEPLIAHWLLQSCEATSDGEVVTVLTAGECKRGEGIESLPVEFEMQIDGAGLITTRYRVQNEGPGNSKIGIVYRMPASVDRLAWRRKSLWSVYPEDHIGRLKGVAQKQGGQELKYRVRPEWSWAEDTGDFFLFGKENECPPATNDFRSLKTNVWYASCVLGGGTIRARVEGRGDVAAKASVLPGGEIAFSLFNHWPYPDLGWGNYTGPVSSPALTTREVRVRLTDLEEEG